VLELLLRREKALMASRTNEAEISPTLMALLLELVQGFLQTNLYMKPERD
jgi:hypothetical protein